MFEQRSCTIEGKTYRFVFRKCYTVGAIAMTVAYIYIKPGSSHELDYELESLK